MIIKTLLPLKFQTPTQLDQVKEVIELAQKYGIIDESKTEEKESISK